MKNETIIELNEVNLGTRLILKNGKEAIVEGIVNIMLPTINKVYEFKTNIGTILPNEVERIADI